MGSKKTIFAVLFTVVVLVVAFLVYRFVAGGPEDTWICRGDKWQKHGNPSLPEPTEGCGDRTIIGGQRDEHGCLGPAGYSWCEVKQKCLRTWEEPCTLEEVSKDLIEYRNSDFGFSLSFPKTWEGYRATQGDYPNYSQVGFSFGGNRQPFTIITIIKYTKDQWESGGKNTPLTVLDQNDARVLVCDGCCLDNGDFLGGGQFDDFQIARCKEGATIMNTFKAL